MKQTEASIFKNFLLKELGENKQIQTFNLKLNEYNKKLMEIGKPGSFREIKIDAIIAIDNDSELLKSQIISHIRSIERYRCC